MAKLQMIKRANESLIFSINIPKEIVEDLNLKKGDNLKIENNKPIIMISKIIETEK
jgi:bifunctional DNA-binding transcriptional regulator/antitoxin component of YhaV-PrlF toxin-antitoxin module